MSARKGNSSTSAIAPFTPRSPIAQVTHGRPVPAKAGRRTRPCPTANQAEEQRRPPPGLAAQAVEHQDVEQLRRDESGSGGERDARRGEQAGQGDRQREADVDHQPRRSRAQATIGQVGDQKRKRVGERPQVSHSLIGNGPRRWIPRPRPPWPRSPRPARVAAPSPRTSHVRLSSFRRFDLRPQRGPPGCAA